MNKFIASYVLDTYGIDVNVASFEELATVSEIIATDKVSVVELMASDESKLEEYGEWDFSAFLNLRKIDCSYNPIRRLIISANKELEYIRFEGVRGSISHKIDFSGNPHLKKVSAGQDGVKELDFSANIELEELSVYLNSSLRWLDVSNCIDLKKISLIGANLSFVDLIQCNRLEYVNINYLNLYRHRRDEYGSGYPRPIVFVNNEFDESVIDEHTRDEEEYAYYLIRVSPNSIEEQFLDRLKSMKEEFLSIPPDIYGEDIAVMHYKLLDIYKSMKSVE